MTTLEQFIQECKDFYNGSPWYGSNFCKIVNDLSPAEALAVAGNGQSIALLLCHMVKWRKSLTIRLQGDENFRARDSDADNWPPLNTLNGEVWEATKKEFSELQEVLIEELGKREEAFLDEYFYKEKTYRYLVSGVIQHDIYHLGQISMLKQLLRNAQKV
ncbi:MAG TPA: DinB family protein [Bacteroidetes bacterium]|nr:DinB family protein [Bacteroidota bacterium]